MSPINKDSLLMFGHRLIDKFCIANGLEPVPVDVRAPRDWHFSPCAYYRPTEIHICVERCAAPGMAGMAWSWPGYVIDRTPYGVLAHELGHHVDVTRSRIKGAYFGDFSQQLRVETGEPKLTNYCPNDAEWFAELFRLYVTNPDLLSLLRPRTYAALRAKFEPVVQDPWRDVLEQASATDRIIRQTERKIAQVQR